MGERSFYLGVCTPLKRDSKYSRVSMHTEDSASGRCMSRLGGVQGVKMKEIDPRKLIWAGHIKESESKSN